MRLKHIFISSFRNILQAEVAPHERFNILYGMNGQGKTNFLEAIFLLGTMKSFRMAKNQDLVAWGSQQALINGMVEKDGSSREISLLIGGEGRKVRIDRKPVIKLADFFGAVNCVVFSPEEITMARGAPEQRRRYLDRAVFSSDASYLAIHHDYHRVLKHRNAMLRRGEREGLDIWSDKLADCGARLMERRAAYLDGIRPLMQGFYRELAGSGENADLIYHPQAADEFAASSSCRSVLRQLLARREQEELRRGVSLAGPHRDDVEFLLNGRLLRLHGSQGQQRSFVLALKMAEIEYLQQQHGAPPVLLLDDMTSELDERRNRNLMEYLNNKAMQVFVTTTDPRNLKTDSMEDYAGFHVEHGIVTRKR